MRRLVTATITTSAFLLHLANAYAGDGSGTISAVHFMYNGVILFSVSAARTNVPPCATILQRFALNGTTPVGKLQVAGLLSAYAQGKQVVVIGTGTCPDWGDTESVSYFYIAG